MEQPLPMIGDAAKLRQIFSICCPTPSSSRKRRYHPFAGATGKRVVTVADTGIGMDAEDVKIAFQPFGQVDNRLERRYEGTGLGLPLTQALVELHKGAITIDSARGKGTRVTVSFPSAVAEELLEAV
jgi:K+-sensing histidine kinase KdpD